MSLVRNAITRHLAVGAAIGSLAAGCARDARDTAVDSVAPAPGPGAASPQTIPPVGDSSSPGDTLLDGRDWNMAKLVKRLESAGLAPVRLPAEVRHSFLSIPGTAFRVGDAELQVFIYPDSLSVTRDMSRLDTIAVSRPGEPVAWATKPTLVRSNNLAAIMLGRNERQIERVQLALTAGLIPPG